MPRPITFFYRRWILANAWAEAVGLGTTLAIGWAAAPAIDRVAGTAAVLAGAAAAVLLGTVLEGVVVGVAQAVVLRQGVPAIRQRDWIWATALGAGIAWLLGMIPSTIVALSDATGAAGEAEPGALLQLAFGAALGLVLGLLLGGAQWFVLRRHALGAHRWIWANAVAWGVGMPLVFVGMGWVPWTRGGIAVIPAIIVVCWVVGTVVGAIHGRILLRIVDQRMSDG